MAFFLISRTDNGGTTPLHLAAQKGHVEVCELLIEACVLLFDETARLTLQVDSLGWSVLHEAAASGRLDVCKLLISKEPLLANYTVKEGRWRGHNAYRVALLRGYEEIAKFLKPYTNDTTVK